MFTGIDQHFGDTQSTNVCATFVPVKSYELIRWFSSDSWLDELSEIRKNAEIFQSAGIPSST